MSNEGLCWWCAATQLLTQVGAVVFELFRELLCVGRLGRDHLPLSGFLQHRPVPIISPNSTHQNPILQVEVLYSEFSVYIMYTVESVMEYNLELSDQMEEEDIAKA